MLFNSFTFLLGFLPATLLVYWLLRRLAAPAQAVLALGIASTVFYAYGEPRYVWLLLASILFNYAAGRILVRLPPGRPRWAAFIVGIGGNLGALAYFKYANFLAANLHAVTGMAWLGHPVVLPIGISFFTFTQIAFLADAYVGKAVESDLPRYFLFVTFFPHLIAGPILHHAEMTPQFPRQRGGGFPLAGLAAGLPMFAIGLFKKCVIADSVSPFVGALFGQAQAGVPVTLLDGWMAALGYSVQIYFDFSGYSDMAVGLGRMFAIDLPVNFNSPYKAVSIIDFWRRWHITLSRFLRDYLYFPLGGNRRGPVRRYVNLFVTMVLGGLWHGAGWAFVIWGALHGGFLIVAHLWSAAWSGRRVMGVVPARLLTLIAVVFAWVPFRATDLVGTLNIWAGMVGLRGLSLPNWPQVVGLGRRLHLPLTEMSFGRGDVLIVLVALAGCLLLPNSQELMSRFHLGLDSPGYHAVPSDPGARTWTLRRHWSSALLAGAIFGIALRFVSGRSEFLYFQF